MTSASTAAGSIRPSRSPTAVLKPARRRARHLGDACAAARTGRPPRRAPARCTCAGAAERFEAESPFDYAACSEVLIVTDVKQGDIAALAGAYARLIEAARGGTLGPVHRDPAAESGPRPDRRPARPRRPAALAQHVDPIDTGTLVDIFRDDPRASLLGTDALRDGVDVPGHSLRLVVMEGVPWPRPTVLHAARRMAGGGSAYDDRVVRARLAQAFGRLIRRQGDCGDLRPPLGGDAVAAALRLPAGRADPARAARRGDRAGERTACRLDVVASQWSRWNDLLTLLRHAKSGWDEPGLTISTARSTRAAARRRGGWAAELKAPADPLRPSDREPGRPGTRNARMASQRL